MADPDTHDARDARDARDADAASDASDAGDALHAHDAKWLLARERGQDVSHVPAGERAAYERLGALLGSGVAPRAGFRDRVLAAIDAAEQAEQTAAAAPVAPAAPAAPAAKVISIAARRSLDAAARTEPTEPTAPAAKVIPLRQRRHRLIAAAGLTAAVAAAAAVVVVLSGPRGAETGPIIALESKVRRGLELLRDSPDRDNQAILDDTLVIRAQIEGGPAEIRVYGGTNARLIASCKHPGTCGTESDGVHRWLVLQAKLTAPGGVHTVVFVGEGIPASLGAFDPDVEAARTAKVLHRTDEKTWTVL